MSPRYHVCTMVYFRCPRLFKIFLVYALIGKILPAEAQSLNTNSGSSAANASRKETLASPTDNRVVQPSAQAGDAKQKNITIPYLGPGADRLPPDEYVRTYKDYIREAIRYGFPPDRCQGTRCDQGLDYLFRTAGLYAYPLPNGADVKAWRHPEGLRECYESGGTVAQIEREKGGALLSAVVVHARTPQAVTKLARSCREQSLRVDRDGKTGLERVAGIPVGYPHPYLCIESQGIVLKRLVFNNSRTADCHPLKFADNAWERQLHLTENSCTEIQSDLRQVWQRKISAADFAERERKRRAERIAQIVQDNGGTDKEAEKILGQYYGGPMDHDLTVVGGALRSLEACNQLGLVAPSGRGGQDDERGTKSGESSGQGKGAQ